MIVGLSGYAGSGKDEVAKILIAKGWTRAAFADPIRDAIIMIDPFLESGMLTSHLVSQLGWDVAKNYSPKLRRMLQVMGTEVGRGLISENVWVDLVLKNLGHGDYVITDVRFENEAAAIKEIGGEIWRVNRPGKGPVNDHISESAMDNYPFDYVLNNDADLEHLEVLVNAIIGGSDVSSSS